MAWMARGWHVDGTEWLMAPMAWRFGADGMARDGAK